MFVKNGSISKVLEMKYLAQDGFRHTFVHVKQKETL
jgi:hypothetical protein